MRAILLCPDDVENFVREIDYDGDYRSIYQHLSTAERKVDLFTIVCFAGPSGEPLTGFVDDEGLLHGPKWYVAGGHYLRPTAGRMLVLSENEDGDSVAVRAPTDWFAANFAPVVFAFGQYVAIMSSETLVRFVREMFGMEGEYLS